MPTSDLEAAVEDLFDDIYATQDVDTCQYLRDGLRKSSVRVIKGFKGTEVRLPDGSYVTLMQDDFIFFWSDLKSYFGDAPEVHDEIWWRDRRFEVNADGTERCYDAMDQWNKMIRVHTTEIVE